MIAARVMKYIKLCVLLSKQKQSQKVFSQKRIPITAPGNPYKINKKEEKQRFLNSLIFPLVFVLILWLVKSLEMAFDLSFSEFGIYPNTAGGLKGIVLSPFVHGSISHLASNSIPLLVLGTALLYFYREVALPVFLWGLLITGFWVWVIGRPSFHIGASGVIYCLAAFLFVSGIIRRHPRLMALSLLVAFLYGGLIWGIFPVREHISWEGHLMGMLSGALLAWFYREHGPQRPLYSWELEEEDDDKVDEMEDDEGENIRIKYDQTD